MNKVEIMLALLVVTVAMIALYGLAWHNQPARGTEGAEMLERAGRTKGGQ